VGQLAHDYATPILYLGGREKEELSLVQEIVLRTLQITEVGIWIYPYV
jgi:hypothetical protein